MVQAGGRECSVCSETQCENNNHMRYWIEGEPTCALIHVLTTWAMCRVLGFVRWQLGARKD